MKIRDAMDRRIQFWKRQLPDQILATFGVKHRRSGPSRWEQYVKAKGLKTDCTYDRPPVFEDLAALFEQYSVRIGDARFDPDADKPVHDDSCSYPIACPTVQFGEGIIGAFFGGAPMFASTDIKTESVCEDAITDWSQLEGLAFDESNPWVVCVLDCLRYFAERTDARFVLQPYCTLDALNFVVALRGTTRAFLDVATDPAHVRQLMEIGFDTTVRYWNLQREIVEANNVAVLHHDEFAAMCPGHGGVGLSVDAYSLCHPSVYDEMGFEFTQRLIDAFGGGHLHIHSLGAHLAPAVSRLKGLTELDIQDDPGCERYFPKVREIRQYSPDLPLRVRCTLDEFLDGLRAHTLPTGVLYQVQGALDSVDEANRLADQVRAYRG